MKLKSNKTSCTPRCSASIKQLLPLLLMNFNAHLLIWKSLSLICRQPRPPCTHTHTRRRRERERERVEAQVSLAVPKSQILICDVAKVDEESWVELQRQAHKKERERERERKRRAAGSMCDWQCERARCLLTHITPCNRMHFAGHSSFKHTHSHTHTLTHTRTLSHTLPLLSLLQIHSRHWQKLRVIWLT